MATGAQKEKSGQDFAASRSYPSLNGGESNVRQHFLNELFFPVLSGPVIVFLFCSLEISACFMPTIKNGRSIFGMRFISRMLAPCFPRIRRARAENKKNLPRVTFLLVRNLLSSCLFTFLSQGQRILSNQSRVLAD